MKNKMIAILGTAVVVLIAISGVALANGFDGDVDMDRQNPFVKSDKLEKDIHKDMIKIMEKNGFKDAAKYMEDGDYEAMTDFMNNTTNEDYQLMIDLMKENGYESMANMMESIGREEMIEMHNSMGSMGGSSDHCGTSN